LIKLTFISLMRMLIILVTTHRML